MTTSPDVLLLGDHAVAMRMSFARHLEQLGFAVTVAAPAGVAVDTGSPTIRVEAYPLGARSLWSAARAVVRIRRESGARVVHAFSTLPATVGSLAAWLDPAGQYVRTVNGLGRSFSTPGVKGQVLRAGYTVTMIGLGLRVRTHVFQNHDDAAWFARTPALRRRRHRVILGSGVDLEQFDPDRIGADRRSAARSFLGAEDRAVAVLVGRHLKTKGIDDLAAAARIAGARTTAPMLFAVVGPPEPNARLAASASDDEHGSVVFRRLGSWSDMPALFAEADVVVLPTTYREGIPRVLLEGAAMRCALLAYDVPGCREIVKTGQNGALVRPGDVDALATTLVDWLSDDARRTALGTASRAVVAEHFAVGTIAEQYADLYRSLLGVPR